MDPYERISEEALRDLDGKKVPLTFEIGGPVIGEATLTYDPQAGAVVANMRVDSSRVGEFLSDGARAVIFRKES